MAILPDQRSLDAASVRARVARTLHPIIAMIATASDSTRSLLSLSRIAIGVDFSDDSGHAIEHARRLARRSGASLVLLHMCPTPVSGPAVLTPTQVEEIRRAHRETAATRLAQIQADLDEDSFDVERAVVDGDPASDLAGAAADAGAELLVVGTQGRTGFRRLLLGSVAEKTVRISEVDVLVARRTARDYRRILVPHDFSERSDRALDLALSIAYPGASIDVLHCWQVPTPTVMGVQAAAAFAEASTGVRADVSDRGKHVVNRANERSDLPIRFIDANVSAAVGIQQQLDEVEYDLVVVGSHGRTGVQRWILGSVAESTVRHADCSVLVAKSPTDE